MNLPTLLPTLLGLAWLLPLVSFVLIVFWGRRMGRGGKCAGYLATLAIFCSAVLSFAALAAWLSQHPCLPSAHELAEHARHDPHVAPLPLVEPISGDWYTLGTFGDKLHLTIGYYIDALTVAMFCMVTLVATCIHVYSFGYMHEELEEMTDPLARLADSRPLRRRGRFYRFYQFLSLFCFSMLGLVIAGNLAMVFAFWELVGICSYLLIGFYIERKSASNAANKAFIVNRVGDFGMIIGLMAIWTGMGTLSFDNVKDARGQVVQEGIFQQVRPAENNHLPRVPDGMVYAAARGEAAKLAAATALPGATGSASALSKAAIASHLPQWRAQGYGYWLLVVAGLGIFCGCVGKSAQFPLHVWLPDAMEGPTPVSALIHAATMVAAGVYLVARCYPLFTPEVLLVIAYTGAITLFIAATIAITATDIKRVLAYSTVSQLGYMMLALGVGGWLAGIFHLFTHAFFKALLFLCSGSVIHATGSNEMPQMGGLWKKMPWTAGTMLIGCLAISGAGIPLLVGLSGYYSKDMILAQLLSFGNQNGLHGWMFWLAATGAAITAFYMFRLWYLTFAGRPRDEHVYQHAHESPRAMLAPLVLLATLAACAGWNVPWTHLGLQPLLEQARPAGMADGSGWLSPRVIHPAEHIAHEDAAIEQPASLWAFGAALGGFLLATIIYALRSISAVEIARQFAPLHRFLLHKWWFDELYAFLFVRPVLWIAGAVAQIDRRGIDWLADGSARLVGAIARLDDWIDRTFVDGLVALAARGTYAVGTRLRAVQTGNVRQYVMFIAIGAVALFILASFYWNYALASP
jgi:NADH-quinone oxidoreductase subunit L